MEEMVGDPRLYVSHDSALHYCRSNPSVYVLDGLGQKIRKLQGCPSTMEESRSMVLSENEFGPWPIDVLVPPNARRIDSERLRHHVQISNLPTHSLCPLYGGVHVVSPELCLLQVCATHPMLNAFEIGMELCGTYALRPDAIEGAAKRDYPLVDASHFRQSVEKWSGLRGLAAARGVANYLVNGSASVMETKLYLLMCLPQKYGGYNFARPELNPSLDVPLSARKALKQNTVVPDMLWRKANVVVEYDGSYHDEAGQMARDALRKSVFEAMGFTVFTFKKWHVYDPLIFDEMVRAVAKKLGKRIRPLATKQAFARDALRKQLLG
ncbi:MAG: DUF559 domain-containing protein [Eggerthellaceae bacterium]|nr:DUF559 domain-containing protein [Eggerthellaceae bacterium]